MGRIEERLQQQTDVVLNLFTGTNVNKEANNSRKKHNEGNILVSGEGNHDTKVVKKPGTDLVHKLQSYLESEWLSCAPVSKYSF